MYSLNSVFPTTIVIVAPLTKGATLRVAVDTLSGLTCQGTVTKYFGLLKNESNNWHVIIFCIQYVPIYFGFHDILLKS